MADEFTLTRTDRPFNDDDRAAMQGFLTALPHLTWEGVCYLFAAPTELAAKRGRVTNVGAESRVLVSNVDLRRSEVLLIPVGDDADRHLKSFVAWCQARWPCALTYYGDPKTPDDLVDEDLLGYVPQS